jgi:hypothetical protein
MYVVRPSQCGSGAELAHPCRAALTLIIRGPARPSRPEGHPPLVWVCSAKSHQLVAPTATINRTYPRFCPPPRSVCCRARARHGELRLQRTCEWRARGARARVVHNDPNESVQVALGERPRPRPAPLWVRAAATPLGGHFRKRPTSILIMRPSSCLYHSI